MLLMLPMLPMPIRLYRLLLTIDGLVVLLLHHLSVATVD